jgi:hypothetical protein
MQYFFCKLDPSRPGSPQDMNQAEVKLILARETRCVVCQVEVRRHSLKSKGNTILPPTDRTSCSLIGQPLARKIAALDSLAKWLVQRGVPWSGRTQGVNWTSERVGICLLPLGFRPETADL